MNVSIPVSHRRRQPVRLRVRATVGALQTTGLVARVVRHRKGCINRAILFIRPGEPKPISASSVMGTPYSFKEPFDHGPAWMRGAFRGCQARRRKPLEQPANPEPDGATRGAWARNGGIPRASWRASRKPGREFVGPDFRCRRSGWIYCAVCLVRAVYAGCHSRLSVVTC
jgi:hypothetical protein